MNLELEIKNFFNKIGSYDVSLLSCDTDIINYQSMEIGINFNRMTLEIEIY